LTEARTRRLPERLVRVLKERATRVSLALAFLLGIGLSFNRLSGVPGVEGALALGVPLPMLAAVLSGRAIVRARRGEGPGSTRDLLLDALLRGALLWLIPSLVLTANMVWVRVCEPGMGLLFLVLGPAIGVQFASVAGLWAALVTPRAPSFAALLVPLLSVVWGLGEFWATPAIFVFSHTAGWFPGTLYDVGRAFPVALLTYRALTLLWIAVATLAVVAVRPLEGRARRPRWIPLASALLLAGCGVAGWARGPALGHRSTVAAIDEALGKRVISERCVLHLPREVQPNDAWRLARDCDFRVHQAERALAVEQQDRVHAFFYRSAQEKERWMGAGRTYIAKPWRDEVHLQLSGWPHPVLAHEVVHAVAARAAQGPFKVSGQLGGWLPDPGLIEGTAVGIDWRESDGMDPHQWARAMRELELLPPLDRLLGLSFLQLPHSVAYGGAGSFTRFYLDHYGPEKLSQAYRNGDFEGPVGKSLSELEAEWQALLDEQELPEGTLELAKLRFDRPSIFETTCPHRLAALKGELGADLAAGDDDRAQSTCREILAIDPGSASTRAALVGALARDGHDDAALEQLAALEGAPETLVASARAALADAKWLGGDGEGAAAIYRELMAAPQSEASRRQLQVKLLAIEAGGRQEAILRGLFLGTSGRGARLPSVVHFAHQLDRVREDGLGSYLAARQLLDTASRPDLALPMLERARARGLSTPELEREAIRYHGRAAYGAHHWDEARAIWQQAQSDPLLRHEAEDWLERLDWRER